MLSTHLVRFEPIAKKFAPALLGAAQEAKERKLVM